MALRRVIADSDDEEDDVDLSPVKAAAAAELANPPPDMEPLSPRQPSPRATPAQDNAQTETSDSTDPSFFARVYDEHHGQALQQAHLIENIERQSQKASRSSGDVSLPAKGKGRATDTSSAPDVASSAIGRKPLGRGRLIHMSDATEVTTPRKSADKDEWDVPSSEDDEPATRIARSAKKRKLSNAAVDADPSQDTSNFYVAQSNLTSSQKLQYRKVHIPDEHNGGTTIQESTGQIQPPPNQKSSCATTIAYSTPSRYASSGPRPPWETAPVTEVEADSRASAADLPVSSPDAIASEERVATSGLKDQRQAEDRDTPVKKISRKRRKSELQDDEDELGQDDPRDSGAHGYHQEAHKPQKSRHRPEGESIQIREANFEPEEDPISDVDPEYGQAPARKKNKPKSVASNSKQSPVAASEAPQPKKRGRKKKQPVSEEVIHDEGAGRREPDPVLAVAPTPVTEVGQVVEKPKRKRGRPRKSDAIKNDAIQDRVEHGTPSTMGESLSTSRKEAPRDDAIIEDSWKKAVTEPPPKGDTDQPSSKAVAGNPKRSASPLKDADSNALLTSQSTTASTSDRSTTTSKATPSQPGKMGYRVGLSKRSRIAPLLKFLKK